MLTEWQVRDLLQESEARLSHMESQTQKNRDAIMRESIRNGVLREVLGEQE